MFHESTWLVELRSRISLLAHSQDGLPGLGQGIRVENRPEGLEVFGDGGRALITLSVDRAGLRRLNFVSLIGVVEEELFYSVGVQEKIHEVSEPAVAIKLIGVQNQHVMVMHCNFPLLGFALEEIDLMVLRFFRERVVRLAEFEQVLMNVKEVEGLGASSDDRWSALVEELLWSLQALVEPRVRP